MGDEEQDAASVGPGPTTRCGPPSAGEPSAAVSGMDQCVTVERELEKVLHKFSGYGQLCERGLEELIDYTGGLKHEILQSHGEGGRAGGRPRGGRGPSLPSAGPQAAAACPPRTDPPGNAVAWVGGWVGEQSAAHGSGRGVLRGRAGRRCASDQWGLLRAMSSSSVSETLVFFFPTPRWFWR